MVERVLETLFLLLIGAPIARVAFDRGVRARFKAFPGMQAMIALSLAVYLLGVMSLAVAAPALLGPATLLALAVVAFERWQARSANGTRRRLPPGSLGMIPIGPWRDPEYFTKQAERHGSVFKFRHFTYPAVGIVGLDRAGDFLRRNRDSLLVPPAPFNRVVPGGFLRYLGGTQHHDIAGIMRSAFSPIVVAGCEPALAAEVRQALATMSSDRKGTADPLPAMDRLALHAMMRCFFGISPGPILDRLESHYHAADYRRLAKTGRKRAAFAVLEIVRDIRELRARSDGVSAKSHPSFINELERLDPQLIRDDRVMANFVYALHTARLDLTGLLMWLLVVLGGNPACLARLASELGVDRQASLGTGGLADRIVRETLRLHQSEFLLRRVRLPIAWDGFEIPAGWYVRVCVQESHRDSRVFANPDRFDPDRFLRSPARAQYSPFGMPPRLCPGEQLARVVARNLAAELASRHELLVRHAEPSEFSGFHWMPNRRLRVSLAPRI